MRIFWFTVTFAAGLITLVIYSSLRLANSDGSVAMDARAVYCLAPANSAGLVQAAAALGLADVAVGGDHILLGGGELTPSAWRAARPADFDRACAALAAPQFAKSDSNNGNSLTTGLTVLVQVGGGALLTLLIDNYRIATERGRTEAADLRNAWRSFTRQVSAYAEARRKSSSQGIPPIGPVDEEREDVLTALRAVAIRHPSWAVPKQLTEQLREGLLGTGLTDADKWPFGEPGRATREMTSRQVVDSLSAAGGSVLQVASALESPIRLGRRP